MSTLSEVLAQGRTLLADGAMGTGLLAMGLRPGEPPEGWTLHHPDRIEGLHVAFVRAGADIILTNTFGANATRLRPFGLQEHGREFNSVAACLARRVADAAGRPVVVAGSMGPLGQALAPHGTLEADEAAAILTGQAEALAEGGVDLVWVETLGSAAEMRAAAFAAARVGLPLVATASFESAGRTREGMTPAAFATAAALLDPAPLAVGVNCGLGPSDVLQALRAIRRHRPNGTTVAKPSAGLPVRRDGALHYPVTPAVMAEHARDAVAAGASIVGGCCGTTPAHLAAMRRALDAEPREQSL